MAGPLPLVALLGITLNPLTLAKDVASAFFSSALALFGSGASALVTALLGFVTTTTDPVFSGGWWSSGGQAVFERVLLLSASVMALAFMCSVITAMLAADRSLLTRAVLRLPVAAIQMALLVAVIAALVSASDEVSASIAKGATGPLSTFVAGAMVGSIADTGVVGLVIGGLVILASLCVWAELLCRSALIYVAVMAGPLIFAASVHPSVRGLQRRYVEGTLALILSKVVVALAFATGSAMLSGLGRSSTFAAATGALLQALAILLIACFSPFVLLRLLIGAEAIVAAEGLERRPFRSAMQANYATSSLGGFAGMVRGLGTPGAPPSGGGGLSGGAGASGPGPGSPLPGGAAPGGSGGGPRPSSPTSAPPPSGRPTPAPPPPGPNRPTPGQARPSPAPSGPTTPADPSPPAASRPPGGATRSATSNRRPPRPGASQNAGDPRKRP